MKRRISDTQAGFDWDAPVIEPTVTIAATESPPVALPLVKWGLSKGGAFQMCCFGWCEKCRKAEREGRWELRKRVRG